jgi:hypothetical protein
MCQLPASFDDLVRTGEHEYAEVPHPLGPLCARGERPRRCADQQSDELTPSHSRPSFTMTMPDYQMITHWALAIAASRAAGVGQGPT